MKTWWLVVRHADPAHVAKIKCDCEVCKGAIGGEFPPEGFAISAFDDAEQARRFADASSSPNARYEAIEVCKFTRNAV